MPSPAPAPAPCDPSPDIGHISAIGCGLFRRLLIFGKDNCQEGAKITFPLPSLQSYLFLLKFPSRNPCLASCTSRTPTSAPSPPHLMGESTLSSPAPPHHSSGSAGVAKVQVVPSDRDPNLRERCLDDDDDGGGDNDDNDDEGPYPLWRNPSTTCRDRVMQGRGGVLK
ncbi:hypothetical protein CH63R_12404 [Colletotrichum higginsianum IMI 349063]|uniref:Uncharacterized protein n=1 Tax=Colletotrichum higginsianum (strain IMI 349063) TaxID=759273 RepID=A0A1B7XU32_COLHI|nr:hypothetical protein CH63R_12404 [Colletotrichum higginsianum IMI 349063]OBR03277.1 hypothetical protein CH63R_12404 [Colletotrichum higginsianum IMI 349063]